MIHTDSFISKDLRGILLSLWAVLDDEPEFFAVLERLRNEQNPDADANSPGLDSEERAALVGDSNAPSLRRSDQ